MFPSNPRQIYHNLSQAGETEGSSIPVKELKTAGEEHFETSRNIVPYFYLNPHFYSQPCDVASVLNFLC